MAYFQPQIQLGRETVLDEPDQFYLHVVTTCPRTNYCPGSHQLDDSDLSNGIYRVTLNVEQDLGLLDLAFDTPVVFTLDLGQIDFPGDEGTIAVDIVVDSGGNRGTTDPPTKTSGSSSTSEAKDNPRPIPPSES